MLIRLSTWLSPIVAVTSKELLCEFRTRYAISVLSMFAIITLAAVSMSIGGAVLDNSVVSALLWVVIFFSAMAGLSRVFVQEQESGTLFTLRVYVPAQAVFFGKLGFNIVLLLALCIIILPLFTMFLNVEIKFWEEFTGVIAAGAVGISAVSTITAAIVACTQGKGSLFTIITFPVLLPQFLAVIQSTAEVLSGLTPAWAQIIFIIGYDVSIIIISSILFDYLWQD